MKFNRMIYQSNPSFSFRGKKLSINPNLLKEFEKSYELYASASSGSSF